MQNISILTYIDFYRLLNDGISWGLPGRPVQDILSPAPDPGVHQGVREGFSPRESGILLCVYPNVGGWELCFIRRPRYDGVHSHQVAFPGGGMEKQDGSIIDTALREAAEEVNIPREKVQVVGLLSQLYVPVSNYMITPVVGMLKERPHFVPQPGEVEYILEVPVTALLDSTVSVKTFCTGDRRRVTAPCFQVNNTFIWGATAMILNEFITLIKREAKRL